MENNSTPLVRCWKDKGDNIGIQCRVCSRTHWDENAPATDPLTKEPCSNCQMIKNQRVLQAENTLHKEQHAGVSKDNQHPENICHHESSQP